MDISTKNSNLVTTDDPLTSILGEPFTHEKTEHTDDGDINSSSFAQRLGSFKYVKIKEDKLPFKFYQLATIGYYYLRFQESICCSACHYTKAFDDFVREPNSFFRDHEKERKECSVAKDRTLLRQSNQNDSGLGASVSSGATSSNHDPSSHPVTSQNGALGGSSTAKLCPTESDSRLPVPVNVKARFGRLASDIAMVQSNRSAPPADEPDSPRVKEAPRDSTIKDGKYVKPVPRPHCKDSVHDTLEGRLSTYHDWPAHSPMDKHELARAGFMYTHIGDKVKCPYCLGGIYNWESTDNAFGEHVKHNPRCEYMKWLAYDALTSDVPVLGQGHLNGMPTGVTAAGAITQDFSKLPAVQAVVMIGYALDTIRSLVPKNLDNLESKNILNLIFEEEKRIGSLLLRGGAEDAGVGQISGAVGGLNLNEMNQSDAPSDEHVTMETNAGEDLYGPNMDNNQSASSSSMTSSASMNVETNSNALPSNTTQSRHRDESNNPEYARVREEYERLHRTNMCRRCKRKAVNVLFLPCRHLVACEECAEKVEDCLQCDEEIIGTVKVFLT